MTVAVPTATPVNVTEHLPDDRVQLAPTVPTAVLDDVKLTEPVGVLETVVVSVTVAVQVEEALGRIVPGVQVTAVDVLSLEGVPKVPSTFVVTTGTPLLTTLVFWRRIVVNPLGLTTA
jgi:hypothetical protein